MARRNLLKGFKRPKGITFEHSEAAPNFGRFVAYPFERGYGVTIGNTLRRILLSSIQGYAITGVRVTSYGADGSPQGHHQRVRGHTRRSSRTPRTSSTT